MFLYLLLLSLARLVSSDLASLRRFAEGGPAPLAKPSSDPLPTIPKVPVSSAPVLRVVSKSRVVGDVTPTRGFAEQQSTPRFIPGVPFGARQVGGSTFFPIKVKNKDLPNKIPSSKHLPPPPHASLVENLQVSSTTPTPTAAPVTTPLHTAVPSTTPPATATTARTPPPTATPATTPPPTATPATSPPPTAASGSSEHSKALEHHARLLEQHAKSLAKHINIKSPEQHAKSPEQHIKSLEQDSKSPDQNVKLLEAQLGLVRLSKPRVNTPVVAAAPHSDLSAVDVAEAAVTELTREQLEEELKAAVRLLKGNWDFVKNGGRLVLSDDKNDPLVISKSSQQ